MARMVPIAPLTRPTSTHSLLVTRADVAKQMTASNPPASSAGALAALGPVWTALMVAMGLATGLELSHVVLDHC